MKCLAMIACLVAFAAAQQKTKFRGASQNNNFPQKFGNFQKGNNRDNQNGNMPQYNNNKWGQKGNSQQQNKNKWGQKGNSQQQQNKNKWEQKGKWTKQFYNKEHKCTVSKIPDNLQTQYESEFKALDVDNNGYLDSKEFKDEGDKISDAFGNFRKGKKPSWYKGNKNGNNNDDKHHNVDGNNQNGGKGGFGRGNQYGGRGGFGRGNQNGGQNNHKGGRGRGDRGQRRNRGGRQLADKEDTGANFWKYLQQKGFVPQKPNQSMKDKLDSMRAAQVFRKFDQDHNNKVSLCEYENAMYRTEMLEKRMGGKNDNMVVVHG